MLAGNRDFEALGNLVTALERIANVDLGQSINEAAEVDLAALLDELRIVISPALQEEEIVAQWIAEPNLPLIWADRPSLMQVFLNLTNNSIRALSKRRNRLLTVSVRTEAGQVLVQFADNGGGVSQSRVSLPALPGRS